MAVQDVNSGQFAGFVPSYNQVELKQGFQMPTSNFTLASDVTIPTTGNLNTQDVGKVAIDTKTTAGIVEGNMNVTTRVDQRTRNGGEIYAKNVHITGTVAVPTNTSLPIPVPGYDVPFQGAYTLGDTTDAHNMPTQGTAKYKGKSTYSQYGQRDIEEGTAEADVDFGTKKLDLNIKSANFNSGTNYHGLSFSGNSFQTPEFNRGNAAAGPNTGYQARGYFYGENAENLGGSYYNNQGLGTYMTDKQPPQPTPNNP